MCNCNVLRGSPVVGLPPDNGADGNQQMTSARAVVTIEGEGRNNNRHRAMALGIAGVHPSSAAAGEERGANRLVGVTFANFGAKFIQFGNLSGEDQHSCLEFGNSANQGTESDALLSKLSNFTPKCQVLLRVPAHVWTLPGWQLQFLGQFLEHWHFALRLR